MTDASRPAFPEPLAPQPTGRLLVLFDRGADTRAAANAVARATGTRAVDAREFGAERQPMSMAAAGKESLVIDRFKVAVVPAGEGAASRLTALSASEGVRRVRPEFYMFPIAELRQRYADWVRSGLALLAEGASTALDGGRAANGAAFVEDVFADTDAFTWGLIATGAHQSRFAGRGIRVAVLDTGFDLHHPDFRGRAIVSRSFVAGEDVQDVQGHGTHCAGTVAGPQSSDASRRYGVAPNAELHIGKVLGNEGFGTEADILLGMNWAIDQECAIISMSLGRGTRPDEKPDPLYEQVGEAALREGSLIVAAAGNESARDFGHVAPVGAPANSKTILAVAAVDPQLRVAEFSSGGINSGGGEVNIAGPGVSVHSSFPMPRRYRTLQGTSMACPHVAGIAALFAESDPSLRGQKLWDALEASARPLNGLSRDVGRGLVQAPDADALTS